MFAQDGSSNARRAAATARSTSAGPPEATVASTAPVAGLTVSNVSPDWACVHSPSISIPLGVRPLIKPGRGFSLTLIVCVTALSAYSPGADLAALPIMHAVLYAVR